MTVIFVGLPPLLFYSFTTPKDLFAWRYVLDFEYCGYFLMVCLPSRHLPAQS